MNTGNNEYGHIKREIPKNPEYPNLSPEEEEVLEKIIFKPNDPLEKVDALFVFGAKSHIPEQIEFIQKYINQGRTKKIILTGGIPKYNDGEILPIPESEALQKELKKTIKEDIIFLLENQSTNSHENVTQTKKLDYFTPHTKVGFLSAEHATRRNYGSLKATSPEIQFLQYAIPYIYEGIALNKGNRKEHHLSKSRVWGEYLRIRKYGGKYGNFDISNIYKEIKILEKFI